MLFLNSKSKPGCGASRCKADCNRGKYRRPRPSRKRIFFRSNDESVSSSWSDLSNDRESLPSPSREHPPRGEITLKTSFHKRSKESIRIRLNTRQARVESILLTDVFKHLQCADMSAMTHKATTHIYLPFASILKKDTLRLTVNKYFFLSYLFGFLVFSISLTIPITKTISVPISILVALQFSQL